MSLWLFHGTSFQTLAFCPMWVLSALIHLPSQRNTPLLEFSKILVSVSDWVSVCVCFGERMCALWKSCVINSSSLLFFFFVCMRFTCVFGRYCCVTLKLLIVSIWLNTLSILAHTQTSTVFHVTLYMKSMTGFVSSICFVFVNNLSWIKRKRKKKVCMHISLFPF